MPAKNHYIVVFQKLNEYFEGNVVTEIPSETRRKLSQHPCTVNKSTPLYCQQVNSTALLTSQHPVSEIYIQNIDRDIDAEELSGYEARESSSAVHSSGNSENRADEGIASLEATLPSPPVEVEEEKDIIYIMETGESPSPKPEMRFGGFDSLMTHLKLRGSILAGQVYPHLDPHKTLYEQGRLELTLCPAYPVNPRDFPLIAHKKQAAIDFRKSPVIPAFEEELKEILEQYGESWNVKIIKNIYEQGELNG